MQDNRRISSSDGRKNKSKREHRKLPVAGALRKRSREAQQGEILTVWRLFAM
jgi:hypothetical protein